MEKIAKRIKVYGKVQGVFYRQSTLEKAISLAICGWVKNNEDGSVEMIAEGNQEAVGLLILWCKQGPGRAVVDTVNEFDVHFTGYMDFKILR